MKKLSTGLISVPMSSVPGDENVEIKTFKDEDAEASNSSGFNRLYVDNVLPIINLNTKNKKEFAKMKKSNLSFFNKKIITAGAAGVDTDTDLSDNGQNTDADMNNASYTGSQFYNTSGGNTSTQNNNVSKDYLPKMEALFSVLKNQIIDVDDLFLENRNNSTSILNLKFIFLNPRVMLNDLKLHLYSFVSPSKRALFSDVEEFYSHLADKYKDKFSSIFRRRDDIRLSYLQPRSGNSNSKISYSKDWDHYIRMDKSGKGYHRTIADIWYNLQKRPNNAPPTFEGYKQWWKEQYANNQQSGHATEVIEFLSKFNPNINTASYKMKLELIKLNNSLSAMGYKNLIKLANHQGNTEIVKELNKLYYNQKVYQIIRDDKNFNKVTQYNIDNINKKFIDPSVTNEAFIDFVNDELSSPTIFDSTIKSVLEDKLKDVLVLRDSIIRSSYSDLSEDSSIAAGASGVSSNQTTKRKSYATDWDSYVKMDKTKKGLHLMIKELWNKYSPNANDFNSYKQWWKRNYSAKPGQGTPDQVVADLQSATSTAQTVISQPAPVSAPSGEAPATTPSQTQQTGSSGPLRMTINGKPSVSIGTFGKDIIYLVLESLDTGNPELYRYDARNPRSGLTPMNSDAKVQFRNSLGPREIAAMERAISNVPGYESKSRYFAEYMKLQRRENRFGPLFRNRRKTRMEEAQQGMRQPKR